MKSLSRGDRKRERKKRKKHEQALLSGKRAAAWTKADEKKLDALVPEDFAGNVTEHLLKQGHILDEQQRILASPGGMRICRFCAAA